jgi:hypothetical protein
MDDVYVPPHGSYRVLVRNAEDVQNRAEPSGRHQQDGGVQQKLIRYFPPAARASSTGVIGGVFRTDSAESASGHLPDADPAGCEQDRDGTGGGVPHHLSSRAIRECGAGEAPNRKIAAWAFTDFVILDKLGVGELSTVFHVEHKSSGIEMALKVYYRSQLDSVSLQQVRDEIAIHSSLSHPDITNLYGFFEDSSGNYYLMLELSKRGDIFNVIHSTESDSQEPAPSGSYTRCSIIYPLITAVAHLHAKGVMHRDVKAENLLLTDNNLSVKLADFGFAVNFTQQQSVTRLGTLEYMVG